MPQTAVRAVPGSYDRLEGAPCRPGENGAMAHETEAGSSTDQAVSLATQGRAALARHAWGEALEKLTEADADGDAAPPDLDAYADAAWWNGRLEQAIELRERAYAAAMRAGHARGRRDGGDQARGGQRLSQQRRVVRCVAPAGGTPARRRRENPGHGWLAATKAFRAAVTGDLDLAMAESIKAEGIAARTGDRNLAAMAQSEHGFALIAGGNLAEGMP